jgi:phosphohistidine phosphatase SixA
MRHGERRHDILEREAQLTSEAKRKASEVAIGLQEEKLKPGIVLTSDQLPTQETARLVFPGVKLAATNLLNPNGKPDGLKWNELSKGLSLADDDDNIIAVVGHHPAVAHLLCSVVGRKCRKIGYGEAIVVSGTPEEIRNGQGFVEKQFGTKDASELLRKKIELKMTVCTFLAGFTIPVLVELLKEPPGEMLRPWRIIATIAFLTSLAWFVAGIFAFDLLLMPTEFWGPIDSEMKPKKNDRSEYALNYRLNGALYANMVRIWKWCFSWGLIFGLLGLAGLVLKGYLNFEGRPDRLVGFLAGGCGVAIAAVAGFYRKLRPRLGIED